MKGFIGTAEPVTKKHLLPIGCCPEALNKIDVVIHVALGRLDINNITYVVRFLVEAQFSSYVTKNTKKKQ